MAKRPTFRQTIVKGTSANDILTGGPGADRLIGGSGNDRLIAAWDDIANTPSGVLIYDGGTGNDTLDFSQLDHAIGVDLYFGPYILRSYDRELYGDWVHYNPSPGDRIEGAVSGIENIIGSEFSDYLQGSSGNNTIYGLGGDDYIANQRGTDVVVGGAGNDYIFMGSHSGKVTGDDDANDALVGNDIFFSGGNDAGIYSVVEITDFDTRDGEADTLFDKLYVNSYQTITWGSNAAGDLVAYRWVQGSRVGEIIFSNLTAESADLVPVFSVDPTAKTIVAISPEWGG